VFYHHHTVFALPLYMASLVRSAPLPGLSGDNFRSLVDTDFYNNVDISLSILRKIVHAIPDTHNACLTSKVTIRGLGVMFVFLLRMKLL
jgi:hypothetical protein